MAELQALAGGRADLLAEVAGIFEGTSEGELDEPLARQAARLCRMAGADPEAIPAWIEEGRRRRAAAAGRRFRAACMAGERAARVRERVYARRVLVCSRRAGGPAGSSAGAHCSGQRRLRTAPAGRRERYRRCTPGRGPAAPRPGFSRGCDYPRGTAADNCLARLRWRLVVAPLPNGQCLTHGSLPPGPADVLPEPGTTGTSQALPGVNGRQGHCRER